MTKEEIIENLWDIATRSEGLIDKSDIRSIVDFVIKHYEPQLPAGLDEAVQIDKEEAGHCLDEFISNPTREYFAAAIEYFFNKGKKAGAEWMAGQGVTLNGRVLPGIKCNLYVESDWFDMGFGGLKYNDKVILQIRKK